MKIGQKVYGISIQRDWVTPYVLFHARVISCDEITAVIHIMFSLHAAHNGFRGLQDHMKSWKPNVLEVNPHDCNLDEPENKEVIFVDRYNDNSVMLFETEDERDSFVRSHPF